MRNILNILESERERIINLHSNHRNNLFEQDTTTATTTNNRWSSATCQGKSNRCVVKVLQVQMKLNDTCNNKSPNNQKLTEDGIWGPKTYAAFTACGGTISSGATSQQTDSASGQPQQTTSQQTDIESVKKAQELLGINPQTGVFGPNELARLTSTLEYGQRLGQELESLKGQQQTQQTQQ
jgi:hypothetical protein